MKISIIIAAMVGLAIAIGVVAWFGFGAVFQALGKIGWPGFVVLCFYNALPFAFLGGAWFVLQEVKPPMTLGRMVAARVVRDASGELLPFSHLAGLVVGARAGILGGLTPTAAFSTTVVDVTAELIAQLGFTAGGVTLLVMRLGAHSNHNDLLQAAGLGLGLSALGAAGFIAVQRRGGPLVQAMIGRFAPEAADQAAEVGRAINLIYQNPLRILAGVALHLCAWVASGLGVWLALTVAGIPVSLTGILALESLVGAVRSVAFMAPMGVGVQEATYALVGPLFGLGPDLALAISLIKRARDIVIGVPALILWQGLEGRKLISGRGSGR